MELINCEEFLGRDYFESYSEFLFTLCCAREYNRIGKLMDMSMMRIDDFLGKKQKLMFKWLIYDGVIYIGDVSNVPMPTEPFPYPFNMDAITENEGNLVGLVQDGDVVREYLWSEDWAVKQQYGKHDIDLYSTTNLASILLHLTAHVIVSIREGKLPRKPFRIKLNYNTTANPAYYVNLYSCKRTLDWFDDLVLLDLDLDGKSVDVDFSLFINNGIMAGRRDMWAIHEKREQMVREGIIPGSICILYERKGLAQSNLIGRISDASIVRIDEVLETGVKLTSFSLWKTIEETVQDFNSIPESEQHNFTDMLNFGVSEREMTKSFYSLGISNYLWEETEFLTLIDKHGVVDKLVTIEGKTKSVEMSQIDAIYWLLCQFKVEFDAKLFKDMYNDGEPLLWDEFGVLID